jgi:hypothetical protein
LLSESKRDGVAQSFETGRAGARTPDFEKLNFDRQGLNKLGRDPMGVAPFFVPNTKEGLT